MLLCSLPGFLSLFLSVSPVFPEHWDRAGAKSALSEARRLREELTRSQNPPKDKYLQIIKTYKQVYLKDPHYSGSDDSIYECGELYQEMGEKFGTLLYYKNAAKMYQFLLKDYESSPRCPEALLRLGDLYAGPLEDEGEAQKAYEQLRTRFKNSKAAAALTMKDAAKEAVPVPSPAGAATAAGEESTARMAVVQNIRHWTTTDYTRIIIDLNAETRYTKTRLDNPDRIFFDLSNAKLSKELSNKTFVVGDEFLKQVRAGQNRTNVVRVVLDFAGISEYSVFELHDPFRIVVDIHGVRNEKADAEKAAIAVNRSEEVREKPIPQPASPEPKPAPSAEKQTGKAVPPVPTEAGEAHPATRARNDKASLKVEEIVPPPPARTTREASAPPKTEESKTAKEKAGPGKHPSPSEQPAPPKTADRTSRGDRTLTRVLGLKIGRIVIDPGHGGHDTGTIGRGGMMEKDLVLRVAQDLKKLLEEKLGAEVILTRDKDTFISLEERTAIANQARADLFLSIHANSSSSRVTSGVETYYLDFARNEAEREVAARENATTVRNVRDLQTLVRRIAQADKSAESRELAAILQKKLYGGARQLFPTAKNRGVRSAPFVVLIGANMPSVLAEVAFISNPRDEKVLKQDANREQLARALFAGIEGYMKTLGSELARNRTGE